MNPRMLRWAIVLGAGDGKRMQPLTGQAGQSVPKQYCTLDGGASLFQLALDRAERVVSPAAVVTVVARQHARWWQRDLARLDPHNVVVQPRNRGTAAGVLLPLLEVRRRDPRGRVVILPSDHWVDREWVLADTIGSAFELLEHDPRRILLLGMKPDQPDPDYGWIVPGGERTSAGSVFMHDVESFIEKPSLETATCLMGAGGLWNSFVVVATVPALIEMYARSLPQLLGLLTVALEDESAVTLDDTYADLSAHDFSRDLLQGADCGLRVVRVPPCGWTDLGTPLRVADCVRRSALWAAGSATLAPATNRVSLISALCRLSST